MQYGIAVVMPEVGRTWYTDTQYDLKHFTFVADKLPAVCRSYFKGMSARREDNMIGGFSMGGYGALKERCSGRMPSVPVHPFPAPLILPGRADPIRL